MGTIIEKSIVIYPGIRIFNIGKCKIIWRDLIMVIMYYIEPDMTRFITKVAMRMIFIRLSVD